MEETGQIRHQWFVWLFSAQIGLTGLITAATITVLAATLTVSCRPYVALSAYLLRWLFNLLQWAVFLLVIQGVLYFFKSFEKDVFANEKPIIQRIVIGYIMVGLVIVFVEFVSGAAVVDYAVAATTKLTDECQKNDAQLMWRRPRLTPFQQTRNSLLSRPYEFPSSTP